MASGAIPPRPGIARLSAAVREEGWLLAVASTSAEESVPTVLEHAVDAELAGAFTVCAGDVVAAKKPAPEIYLHALEMLGVDVEDAAAVEDTSHGLRAASGMGIATIVTVSSYSAGEDFAAAALVVSDLGKSDAPLTVLADAHGVAPARVVDVGVLERVRRV